MDFGEHFRLAAAQNIATNGRMFCAALILINIVAANYGLAVLAAVPVGVSCIVDTMQFGRARSAATVATYLFAIGVAIITFIVAG